MVSPFLFNNGTVSKIEYCNDCKGFIEEPSISNVNYKCSLFGFTKQVNFIVTNTYRCEPIIECGTITIACDVCTSVTDTAADFLRRGVRKGDLVINTSDCCATWRVTNVCSKTVITVQLCVSGGGGDNWVGTSGACCCVPGDAYTIKRRNQEKLFVPNKTKIKATHRQSCIPYFEGIVQEIDPTEEFFNARYLEVIACGYCNQVRDAQPTTSVCFACCADIRSTVIKNIFDDKTSVNQLVFPLVSGEYRIPGIEVSPNANTVAPDFANSTRMALPQLLDLAATDFWTRTAITNALAPATICEGAAGCSSAIELTRGAEGSLATRFETNCQFCMGTVTLQLNRLACTTGNIYIRIVSEEPVICNPIPASELVVPWAESNLINIANLATSPCTTCQVFTFDAPIPLAKCTGYWIVLEYQADNNNFVTATTAVNWIRDDADIAACNTDRVAASWSCVCNVWTTNICTTHIFTVTRFSEAVWLWDVTAGAFVDQTPCIEADDASAAQLLATGGSCDTEDRLYIGLAGPIRGLQFCYSVASSAEYGTWNAKYLGSHRGKIYGTHTAVSSATVLTDITKDFRQIVCVGDIIYNLTDNSVGVITNIGDACCACPKTKLTVSNLLGQSSGDTFALGDEYTVLGWMSVANGINSGTSCTVMTDACGAFGVNGIRVGDIVVNETDNLANIVTVYNATTITSGTGMSWAACDAYRVYSRWRDLPIREINNTFTATPATLLQVTFEWTIPADWLTRRFNGNTGVDNGPEAVTGPAAARCCERYWLVLQNSSIPATPASIDVLSALPGAGFGVKVSHRQRLSVICTYACASHDGGACAAALVDSSRNFFGDANTVGIFVGDTVVNKADCDSSAVITAITSQGGACTTPNCTVAGTLAGGCQNDWDAAEAYLFKRCQYPLEYFRLGSRPYKGANRYGMTLQEGIVLSCQQHPLHSSNVNKTSKASTNRATVIGRNNDPCVCLQGDTIKQTVGDQRGQREYKRTVQKTVVDYNITSATEAIDRAQSEVTRFVDAQERVELETYGWPISNKTITRKSWTISGILSGARMDSDIGTFCHDGGSVCKLVDTSQNFLKWCIVPGDLVTNNTCACCGTMVVTGICTTTNKNDTLTGTIVGRDPCRCNDWLAGDCYTVTQRKLVQSGDLVTLKVGCCCYINECYLVTQICFEEPSQRMTLQLARNFSTSIVGDLKSVAEITQFISDTAKRGSQSAAYNQ